MGMTMNMLVLEAPTGGLLFRVGDRGEVAVNAGVSDPATSSVIRFDNSSGTTLILSRMPATTPDIMISDASRGSIELDNDRSGEQNFMFQVSLLNKAGMPLYMIMLSVTNALAGQNRCRFIGVAMWP